MSSLVDIMGQEIYDLIYLHYDSEGNKIDEPEDFLYCDESDIDFARIEPLIELLTPISDVSEALVPLEAARLLAAWGVDAAIDYFECCIDNRIDRLGNIEPHRLHGYDTIYEEIEDGLFHYYARCIDRSKLNTQQCLDKVKPLIIKIINLAMELPHNMMSLIQKIKRRNWRFCEDALKECFIIFLKKEEKNRNDYWNIIDLKILFQSWSPHFLADIEKKYGTIDIPESIQERF